MAHRELETSRALQIFGELAGDPVDTVDLTALERRQPRRLIGHALDHDAFDVRRLAPIAVERVEGQFDAGVERYEFVGTGADRRLLETVFANLLDIFLRHDPARPGRAAVKGQEVRPRLLETEMYMARIGRLDCRDA